MAHVFISYARADHDRIEPLVKALTASGHEVWWDRDIAQGQNFRRVIEDALNRASCVIVAWTEAALSSEYVINEAATANKRGVLVPVLLDLVDVPLEFRHLQLGSLIGWNGHADAPQLKGTLAAVARYMAQTNSGTARAGPDPRPSRAPVPAPRAFWTTRAGLIAALAFLILSVGVLLIGLQLGNSSRETPPAADSTRNTSSTRAPQSIPAEQPATNHAPVQAARRMT